MSCDNLSKNFFFFKFEQNRLCGFSLVDGDIKQFIEKKVNETTEIKWSHCVQHTGLIKEDYKLWQLPKSL